MVCVYCGKQTKVVNSRPQRRNNQIWRRRQCLGCGAVFTTHEAVDLPTSLSVRQNDRLRPFLPDLLYAEVLLAMQDRKDCYTASREVISTIIKRLLASSGKPVFEPREISAVTAKTLKRFDKRAWLRYVAEHPSLQ